MIRKHKRKAITLRRDLGLFEATLAGIGIIVGAGIYVMIGAAAGYAGNSVWISFIIAAFVAFLTGLSYAELSSIYTEDSGEYSYVEHNFNKRIGFVTGYLVVVSLLIASAAVSLGFSGYLNQLFGSNHVPEIAIAVIALFSVINYIGIKQSIRLNIGFTILSILGLIFIVLVSASKIGSIDYFEITNYGGIFKAASLIFFAFIGFESIVKLSEETKNPRKNIPLALILSLSISTVFYIIIAICVISVVSPKLLAESSAPLALVASTVLGSKAGLFVSIVAIVSTGNTVLMELIAVSRMLYSMAHEYPKLMFLSKISKKTNTPYIAIIFSAIFTMLFVLIGEIEIVVESANFFVFLVFALVNLALIKSRYNNEHHKEVFHSPFNIGKFPVLALLGFLSTLFLIFSLETIVIITGTGITALGFVMYEFLKVTDVV